MDNLGIQGLSPCLVATTLSKVEVPGTSPPSVATNRSNLEVRGSSLPLVAPNLFHQHAYVRGRLDDHVEKAAAAFQKSSSWGDFIRGIRGQGDLHPEVGSLNHPAAHLLSRFQKSGTPAGLSAAPWSNAKFEMALKWGPHRSSHNGIEFLCTEYADMMDKQQWTILPASMVKNIRGLRLSPL